jgi:hypothetical protein
LQFDPTLGWTQRSSYRAADLYGPGRHFTTNARGLRALEEYERSVPAGRYRVLCLGGSAAAGVGVDDTGTLAAELQASDPRLQVLNLGQCGYSVDQAYLWYRQTGLALDAQLLLVAFTARDFERLQAERGLDGRPKPRLELHGDALRLANAPLRESPLPATQGQAWREFWARTSLSRLAGSLPRSAEQQARDPAAAGFDQHVGRALIADLIEVCRAREQALALVLLPVLAEGSSPPAELATWLAELSPRLGVLFVDLSSAFAEIPTGQARAHFLNDELLNGFGNRHVAERLMATLLSQVPGFPR